MAETPNDAGKREELGARNPEERGHEQDAGITRRGFLGVAAATGAAVGLGACSEAGSPSAPAVGKVDTRPVGAAAHRYVLHINGEAREVELEPRVSLLDALREYVGLTGTKKGCDHGQCGACTVLLNGERRLSCLTLAIMCQNDQITTIEGLAKGDNLHPVQAAFIECDAFQCGYCTPGQILSAVACVKEGHAGSDAEIREYMSGNLCRCAAYPHIVAAVKQARDAMEKA